jgi:hypothetical protein
VPLICIYIYMYSSLLLINLTVNIYHAQHDVLYGTRSQPQGLTHVKHTVPLNYVPSPPFLWYWGSPSGLGHARQALYPPHSTVFCYPVFLSNTLWRYNSQPYNSPFNVQSSVTFLYVHRAVKLPPLSSPWKETPGLSHSLLLVRTRELLSVSVDCPSCPFHKWSHVICVFCDCLLHFIQRFVGSYMPQDLEHVYMWRVKRTGRYTIPF